MPMKNEPRLEKELQERYVQLQMMRQQMGAFIEEKQAIDERMNELNVTIDALHKLEDIASGAEIWSSIGSGSFVRSDIKDTERVLITIGAGVVVKEKRERAIEIVQSRMEQLVNLNNEIIAEITKYSQAIERLEPELERLAAHLQKDQ